MSDACLPLLEVIPRTTELHVSAKTDVNNRYINHFKLSSVSPLVYLSAHYSNGHFLSGSVAINVIKFAPPILLPSPYHVQDVFLPQSLPDLFTFHSLQSAHSLNSSQHTHLGSLHSPLLLLSLYMHHSNQYTPAPGTNVLFTHYGIQTFICIMTGALQWFCAIGFTT